MRRPSASRGHLWTIAPALRRMIWQRAAPRARPWRATRRNERGEPVEVRGQLRQAHPGAPLAVLVHGLGGEGTSPYMIEAARAMEAAGVDVLRLALGGHGEGADLYHAGLTADVRAALEHPLLARRDTIWVIGFSLGGHITLRAAAEGLPERVRAVAAVCAPVDLTATIDHIDSPRVLVYRRHVLGGLRELYARLDAAGRAPTPVERVRRVDYIRDFDALAVVPRFGFRDTAEYYHTQSAARVLDQIEVPTLFAGALSDPMIPSQISIPHLTRASATVDVRWLAGAGHAYFSPSADLGEPGPRGFYPQLISWLRARS